MKNSTHKIIIATVEKIKSRTHDRFDGVIEAFRAQLAAERHALR